MNNMANTFTQIHIHVVFAVQNRVSLIDKSWQERFGFRPTQALSNLMQEVKRDSSEWINKEKLVRGKFSWQEGYGAFSYSKSHISQVATYIETQEKHHKKKTFLEEYKKILQDFDLEYDEQYIFKPVDD
jgi:REP element-mobilizing transposase RayT